MLRCPARLRRIYHLRLSLASIVWNNFTSLDVYANYSLALADIMSVSQAY